MTEQDCLKKLLKTVRSKPYAGSLSSSGSEFQTVGPAIENARRPYVLRRQRGTMSWWRFAERRRSWEATSEDVVKWSEGTEMPDHEDSGTSIVLGW